MASCALAKSRAKLKPILTGHQQQHAGMTASGSVSLNNSLHRLRTVYAPANAVASPTWLITSFRTVATNAFSGRARIGSRWHRRLVTTAANNRLNVAPTIGTPKMTRLLTHNGQTHSICGWAAKNGITKSAMYQRLERGWTLEEACANKRTRRSALNVAPTAPVVSATTLRLEELKRMDLMLQREMTRVLRQFCRDLEGIMSRGVVRNLPRWPVDRSIPVARSRV
jgi:hypothetical protein